MYCLLENNSIYLQLYELINTYNVYLTDRNKYIEKPQINIFPEYKNFLYPCM